MIHQTAELPLIFRRQVPDPAHKIGPLCALYQEGVQAFGLLHNRYIIHAVFLQGLPDLPGRSESRNPHAFPSNGTFLKLFLSTIPNNPSSADDYLPIRDGFGLVKNVGGQNDRLLPGEFA